MTSYPCSTKNKATIQAKLDISSVVKSMADELYIECKFEPIKINAMPFTKSYDKSLETKLKSLPSKACGPFGILIMGIYFLCKAWINGLRDVVCSGTAGTEIVALRYVFKKFTFHLVGDGKWDNRITKKYKKQINNVILYKGSLDEIKKKIEKRCGYSEIEIENTSTGGSEYRKVGRYALMCNNRFTENRDESGSMKRFFNKQKIFVEFMNPALSSIKFRTSYKPGITYVQNGILFKYLYSGQTDTISFLISSWLDYPIICENNMYNNLMLKINTDRVKNNYDKQALIFVLHYYEKYYNSRMDPTDKISYYELEEFLQKTLQLSK